MRGKKWGREMSVYLSVRVKRPGRGRLLLLIRQKKENVGHKVALLGGLK